MFPNSNLFGPDGNPYSLPSTLSEAELNEIMNSVPSSSLQSGYPFYVPTSAILSSSSSSASAFSAANFPILGMAGGLPSIVGASRSSNYDPSLWEACKSGDLSTLKRIIESSPDFNVIL